MVIPVGYDMNSSDLVKKIEASIKTVNQKYYAVVTIDKNYVSTYVNDPKMK